MLRPIVSILVVLAAPGCIFVPVGPGKGGGADGGPTDGTAPSTETTDIDTSTPLITDVDELCGAGAVLSELSSPIDSDTTLTADRCWRLPGIVSVTDGATLVIEPGVTLVAEEDAGLSIESDSALVAEGTASAPISIVGTEPWAGWWTGVIVSSAPERNSLEHVTIAHAGSRTWYTSEAASLHANDGGGFSLSDVRLAHGADVGLSLESDGEALSVSGLQVIDHGGPATTLYPHHIGSLDASNRMAADGADTHVRVKDGTFGPDDVRWEALDVPWQVEGMIETLSTDLTLAPGLEITFDIDAGLVIDEDGRIEADGTTDAITLRGSEPGPGWWTGLIVYAREPGSFLQAVQLDGGGSRTWYTSDEAQLYVEGQLAVDQITVSQTDGYGVVVDPDGELTSFTHNSLSGAELGAMRVGVIDLPALDATSTYGDPVYVRSEDGIDSDGHWPAIDQAIVFEGITDLIDSDITVDPGAWLLFEPDAGLVFDETTLVEMVGTETEPITLEGTIAAQGTWTGVILASIQPGNQVAQVQIHHAGSRTWYTSAPAGLYVEDGGRVDVSSTTISESGGWGLYAEDDALLVVDAGSCSFGGNADGDIRQ